MSADFYKKIEKQIAELTTGSELRTLRAESYDVPTFFSQEKQYVNLSSNDYLGIGSDKSFSDEFLRSVKRAMFGSTGSRLITGNDTSYEQFESYLEGVYSQSALMFNSGYHANQGIIPTLCSKGDLIIADRLVHRSIIEGMKSSEADFERFRHLDYEHLEKILNKKRSQYQNVWIITESIFSMDGDLCDLGRLVELKKKYDALLYVDEAHSIGVLGRDGLGICAERISEVDIVIMPLGKAPGSQGAICLCPQLTKQFLINRCPTMIFSTAIPPVNVLWSQYAFEKMIAMDCEREKLTRLSSLLRSILTQKGIKTLGSSHIVPIMIPSSELCVKAAQKLRDGGFWCTAIRYPTVPKDQQRIRISLNTQLSDEQIQKFADLISQIIQ